MSDALERLFANRPEHLQVEDLCEMFGCTRATAYQWLKNGTIPAYQIGRTWVILRDEVRAAVQAGSNQIHQEPEE